jgi:cytochrome c-type biogenesis protein CcmH
LRALAGLAAVLALALPGVAVAQETQTSLADIEDEVMCPICGVTLELATEAPQAIQEREFIRERIAQGQSKEEIKDALVAEFGPEVLAVPETEGFDLAAWLVPGIGILVAAIGILFALRRWRREAGDGEDGGSAKPPADGLSEEDSQRLDADLARYDP